MNSDAAKQMLQLLKCFRQRVLCKSLELGKIESYSILVYLPPTPDDVQCKQLTLFGVQLDVELTQSFKNLPHVSKMLLKRF